MPKINPVALNPVFGSRSAPAKRPLSSGSPPVFSGFVGDLVTPHSRSVSTTPCSASPKTHRDSRLATRHSRFELRLSCGGSGGRLRNRPSSPPSFGAFTSSMARTPGTSGTDHRNEWEGDQRGSPQERSGQWRYGQGGGLKGKAVFHGYQWVWPDTFHHFISYFYHAEDALVYIG